MKKYVLNIEKLFTGETANALVLNQVDEELPVLLPSMKSSDRVSDWIYECQKIYPDFNPGEVEDWNELNDYIMKFNLDLQSDFKKRGHEELYLMDDTQWMRPDPKDSTFATDKVNMHLLNGSREVKLRALGDDEIQHSSQMNVLFPYKKVSSKSLYSEALTVDSPYELDNKMESSRQMTLQGKVTKEDCSRGAATVGGNMYVMSPLVESTCPMENLVSNGMTIVNSFLDSPYHFPHTLTLFQPSKDRYKDFNLESENWKDGITPFVDWYEKHNRRTVVSIPQEYGENTSYLKCLGAGSYELELATYGPTDIVVGNKKTIPLTIDKFREIRANEDDKNKYEEFPSEEEDGKTVKKYVFDNRILDGDKDIEPDAFFKTIGFKFNLYDNFISGQERILRLHVPQQTDFDKLVLKFTCAVSHPKGLLGYYEYIVFVGDEEKFRVKGQDNETCEEREINHLISDAVVKEGGQDLDIRVVVHFNVEFNKRNTEKDYQDLLRGSGITLNDIRLDSEVVPVKRQLTFADYVNEDGISSEEREHRISQFWKVSQYKKDIPYQLVLETSLRNVSYSGIAYPNNYSTGDIYGDVFTTKSVLDPNYDMNLTLDDWYDDESRWATEEEKNDKEMKKYLTGMIRAIGREYIGLGNCSNQLFLLYKPTDLAIGYLQEWRDLDGDEKLDSDERIISRRGWRWNKEVQQ